MHVVDSLDLGTWTQADLALLFVVYLITTFSHSLESRLGKLAGGAKVICY